MRTRAPSFKSEIAAYRQRFVKERADYPRLAPALRVLDRWSDHPATEAIWKTINERLPAEAVPTAEQLINLVLQRWDAASALNERVPQITDIEIKTRHRIKDHLHKRKYRQIARLAGWLDKILQTRTRLLGRQGAGQKQFMKAWSESFQGLSGKPLDATVASLTEIAFDGKVTVDMVRRARQDRSTRPPK
jgi:hypothetical protein